MTSQGNKKDTSPTGSFRRAMIFGCFFPDETDRSQAIWHIRPG